MTRELIEILQIISHILNDHVEPQNVFQAWEIEQLTERIERLSVSGKIAD
jgi:hypothetical protein